MARPPKHWRLWRTHPAHGLGFPESWQCEGDVRRLYVRTQATWRQGGSPSWQGIGWICDGCGESVLDADWQNELAARYADQVEA